MSLTVTVTPGYTFGPDELITPDKANAAASPVINLQGSVGTAAVADGSITTAKLANTVLSADTPGRAKMADGFVTAAKLDPGVALSAGVRNTRNLRIATTSGTVMAITCDEAVLRTSGGTPIWLSGFNVTTGRGTGSANNLDTGSFTASTWYYIYLISDGTNKASLLSLSATAPTMPGSYSYFTLVGAVYNGSGNSYALFDQVNNRVYCEESGQLITNGTGLVSTWNAISLSALVPATAKTVIGNMGLIASSTKSIRVSGAANPGSVTRALATYNGSTGTANNNGWFGLREFRLELATSQQIQWSSGTDTTASTYKVTVTGWEF